MLIIDESERLLLVQHWARGETWSLLGGGLDKDETPIQAARRELEEEIGVQLPGDRFTYLATVQVGYEAPLFVVRVQAAEIPARPARPFEITAMQWFALSDLPKQLSKAAQLGIVNLQK